MTIISLAYLLLLLHTFPQPKVADHGLITALGPTGSGATTATLLVGDVKKAAGGSLFVHSAEVMEGALRVGSKVRTGV